METLTITIPGFVIINGYMGSGKSHLIKWLVHKYRKQFDYAVVFCNTSFAGDSFKYIDPKFIHPTYEEEKLIAIMDLQADLVKQGVKKNCLLIMDDCLDDNQFKSPPFKRLCTQLRHYNITCIISCQYPNAIPPRFRTNAFQSAIFFMGTEKALKALYESYGQMFETFRDFKGFVMKNTGNYNFILYDSKNLSPKIEDKYKVYCCPVKIPNFTLTIKAKIKQ